MSGRSYEIPEILKAYREDDFGLQAKATFFYKVAIIMALSMLFVILYTSIIQLKSPDYGHLYFPVLIPEILIFLLILFSIYLLIKGKYRLSTHILVVSSFLAIWAIMFLDKSKTITRYDTVVYIFAVSSMLPLVLRHGKISMQIYIGVNILVVAIFIYVAGSRQEMPVSIMAEFFLDMLISLIFTGIVGYKIFTINKNTQERAINDINERHEAEKALLASEKKYSETIDLLPQTIYEADLTGRLTYINKSALKSFGYTYKDYKAGLNVLNMIIENERASAGENISKFLTGEGVSINEYTALRKDRTTFPVEIYSGLIREDNKVTGFRGIIIDITERKSAERELLESRQQYKTLATMSPVGIFRTDSDGNTTYVNPKWSELSGLTSEEALGDGWLKAVHPDDREFIVNNWNTDFSTSSKSIAEYRFLRPDGKVVWVLGNAVPEIINGEIKGYVGTITNISEIKDTQSALEMSEKRFRDLADLLPQTVWESTMDGRLIYVNKHGQNLFGYDEDDIYGYLNIFECLLDEDRERAQINVQHVINNTRPRFQGDEYTGRKKDGSLFPIKAFISIIYEGVIPAGIRAVVLDMSEIKKTEYELKESEARYRSIIEAFPDIIMISDLTGNIIFGNEALERITGIVPEDYRNLRRQQKIHPDDLEIVASAIRDLLKGSKKSTGIIENRFIDKWGKVHWFSGIISKIIVNGEIMLQTITRDVTEKKANEIELDKYRNRLESLVKERTDELEATNEELVAVNEKLVDQHMKLELTLENLRQTQKQLVNSEKLASLGVLAAGVAHEINNPLNFIQGGITGLENYFEDNLENYLMDIKPLIEGMNEGVRRAANIVASLSHYSRQSDIPMTLCDIHNIIDNCLVIMQNQTKNRITITKDYINQPLELNCNEGKMHQAILNLLANAVQSIEKEGTISIRTSLAGEKLELIIADTGHGISEENIPRIFDPFFTTKEPGKGTGLGLSITYNIILEHNGEIHCSSKLKEGTQFLIYLPARIR